MSLGEMIAEKRLDKGLRQEELANLLKLSRSTISSYENDTHSPDVDTLRKMADIFDTSTDYLLERIRYDVDLKTLSKRFSKQLLTGDILKQIVGLSQQSKDALTDYIDLLRLKENNADMK